ncbi:MAG: hypothetical protein R3Y26_09990 [Rikenellaceae bacterium]
MEKVEVTERIKKVVQKTADIMNKIMRIYVYICIYPALWFIFTFIFDINILPSVIGYSSSPVAFTLGIILYSLSIVSIPTYLWFILTLFVKKVHPVITIAYFILFVTVGIVSTYLILCTIAYCQRGGWS